MIIAPWMPGGSWSVLVTAPTEEPLTLDEAKLRAGLDWPVTVPPDPRDALMRDHIAAARSQVERDTGLALITQIRDVYFFTMSNGQVALPAQSLPLQEVISVDPVEPVVGGLPYAFGGAFTIARSPLAAVLADISGLSSGIARVKVGWLDAADLRQRAPLLLQAVGLLCAHFATAGRDAVITGTIAEPNSLAYEEAIASYRLIWIP